MLSAISVSPEVRLTAEALSKFWAVRHAGLLASADPAAALSRGGPGETLGLRCSERILTYTAWSGGDPGFIAPRCVRAPNSHSKRGAVGLIMCGTQQAAADLHQPLQLTALLQASACGRSGDALRDASRRASCGRKHPSRTRQSGLARTQSGSLLRPRADSLIKLQEGDRLLSTARSACDSERRSSETQKSGVTMSLRNCRKRAAQASCPRNRAYRADGGSNL